MHGDQAPYHAHPPRNAHAIALAVSAAPMVSCAWSHISCDRAVWQRGTRPMARHDPPQLCPSALGTGAALVWAAATGRAPGRGLVGAALDRLDPHDAGSGRGHPLEPQAPKEPTCLPPTWTAEELGKRSSIERCFGRVFSLFSPFRLQRPPLAGWTAVETRVALTYAATVLVGLAAQQAGRPDLIRSPTRVCLPSLMRSLMRCHTLSDHSVDTT
jgi:hypothetical protein